MKKMRITLLVLVLILVSCKSSPETRRTVSASGDPEDIFFEKNAENVQDLVAQSVIDDLDPSKVTRYDIPNKKPDISGNFDEVGYSSWYGSKYQGKPTASGELFDSGKLTAAHRTLPMGSIVKVHNLENNKTTMIRVNDRGPFVDGRIIDVSEKAADILEFKEKGITKVGLKVVKSGNTKDVFEDLDANDLDEEINFTEDPKLDNMDSKKSQPNFGSTSANRPRGFTVQVGVFREITRAENYKSLMSREYKEKVFLFSRNDGYVVQVGDFTTRDDAERLKSKLRYDGIECFIPPK